MLFLLLPSPPSALGWERSSLPTSLQAWPPAPGLAQVYPQPRQAVQGRGWNEVGATMAQIEEADRNQEETSVCGGGWPTCAHPLEIQGICSLWEQELERWPAPATAASGEPSSRVAPWSPGGDWPRASPEWKCTSEKDPAGGPGEGVAPLREASPSLLSPS